VWGIGISVDSPDANNPAAWKGKNLLGKVLMKVRQTLTEEGNE